MQSCRHRSGFRAFLPHVHVVLVGQVNKDPEAAFEWQAGGRRGKWGGVSLIEHLEQLGR